MSTNSVSKTTIEYFAFDKAKSFCKIVPVSKQVTVLDESHIKATIMYYDGFNNKFFHEEVEELA